jgi:multidrug efflux pump subunit AcrA (membrane-fusion protein)
MGGGRGEARIQPKDVASIEVGQEAEIVVSSFNRRLIDPFEATVDYVAADSQMDQLTGESYFAVRLSFDDAGKLQSSITPGMPAESYIQLGSRSFVGYLFKPLSDSFRKAFQER